jgi:hypothetical protein
MLNDRFLGLKNKTRVESPGIIESLAGIINVWRIHPLV